jgi:hypothetical protein
MVTRVNILMLEFWSAAMRASITDEAEKSCGLDTVIINV